MFDLSFGVCAWYVMACGDKGPAVGVFLDLLREDTCILILSKPFHILRIKALTIKPI